MWRLWFFLMEIIFGICREGPLYQVPAGSNKSTIYILSPWLAGFDENDSIHLAAQLYNGQDFLSGPIVDIAQFNDTVTAQEYDMIWKINRWQVEEFKQQWQLGNVTNGFYTIPMVIATWPGNHPGMNDRLAPYFDYNQDGDYDPMDGDYPEIKGDQMLWWVYNDNTQHTGSGGEPLGAEFRVSFYAFFHSNPPNDSVATINDITFLNFEIVNRSLQDYDSTRFGIFTDFDIGYAYDDLLGCHVDLNSFYAYNGEAIDGSGQINAYGGPTPPPPSQAINFLSGPEADPFDGIDNNRDGTVDEHGERWGMSHFMAFSSNPSPPFMFPNIPIVYYNYMQSVWSDSTHLVYGGNGYPYDTTQAYIQTNYAYPGSSDPQGWGQNGQVMPPWDQTDFPAGDRKGIGSCGPFTFEQGEMFSVDIALSYARPDTGNPLSSLEENFGMIEDVIIWFQNDSFPSSYTLSYMNPEVAASFIMYPNPTNDKIHIKSNSKIKNIEIFNLAGILVRKEPANTKSITIDVSLLASGNYIVRVIGQDAVSTKKFVVIR